MNVQITAKRPSWRDVIRIHPPADLFPRLSEDELGELGADIRARGFIVPPASRDTVGERTNLLGSARMARKWLAELLEAGV